MDRIEFDAQVESNEIIRIPAEYVGKLHGSVHVTAEKGPNGKTSQNKMVQFMREHPLVAPGATPLSREELYGRS